MLPVSFGDLRVRARAVMNPAKQFEIERQARCLEVAGFGQAARVHRTILGDRGTWGGSGALQFPNVDSSQDEKASSPPSLVPGLNVGIMDEEMVVGILSAYPEYGIDAALAGAVTETLRDCVLWEVEGEEIRARWLELVRDIGVYEATWLSRLSEIDRNPDVKSAMDGILPCLHQSSPYFVEVTDPGLFLVDDRELSDEEIAPIVRMAMVCIRPMEELRRPLREAMRAEYVDEHYAELLEWQERIVSVREAIEALEVG